MSERFMHKNFGLIRQADQLIRAIINIGLNFKQSVHFIQKITFFIRKFNRLFIK